jgi:hypothetical protein
MAVRAGRTHAADPGRPRHHYGPPAKSPSSTPRLPHWFGPAGEQAVEILSLLGRQGERIHVRAAPRSEVNYAR